MPGQKVSDNTKPYISIVGGNIVQKVDKSTPGARLREYELANGQKGEKWELVYMSWTGKVHNISFKDTEYGTVCNIDLGDALLTLNTSGRYFTDLACKLLSADITQELVFHPYDMEVEGGKKKQGVSLQQNGEKLKNFFWDGKQTTGDFPVVDEEKKAKLKKNYWKTYFAEVEAFLIEKLENLIDLSVQTSSSHEVDPDILTEDNAPLNDLPF